MWNLIGCLRYLYYMKYIISEQNFERALQKFIKTQLGEYFDQDNGNVLGVFIKNDRKTIVIEKIKKIRGGVITINTDDFELINSMFGGGTYYSDDESSASMRKMVVDGIIDYIRSIVPYKIYDDLFILRI